MSVLNNATFANPSTSYFALKSDVGNVADWYTYPSQNGQVLLIDASGTQILRSIDGNLFYNNELLAKANDIQDIADWSLYPSIATVELAGQNITQVADMSASTVHVGTGTFNTVNSSSVAATSVTATSNIQGGSLTTTGGLDMTNTGITRASSVGISAGGFAPYGSLSSPDGVMLTWNGAQIQTGGAGNVAQWANYKAVASPDINGNNITNVGTITATTANTTTTTAGNLSLTGNTITATGSLVENATGDITTTTTGGLITRNSYANINDNAGSAYNLTVDRFLTPLGAPINITAQNGLGGNIQLTAGTSANIPPYGSTGFGQIGLSALGSTNGLFSLGGKIDITAYSGGVGEYGGATSRVSASAATIALSAGAAPTLPGLAGSMNIFGNGAVSIVSAVTPPVLPQIPETVYVYGLGAVRFESPGGVQSLSDFYAGDLYPISGSDLILQGRSLPNGYVKVRDCNELTMTGGANLQTDSITGVGGSGNATTIPLANANIISPFSSNLVIKGKTNILPPDYYVEIQNADTIAFDAAGAGALTGVQSINGAAWPPPTGDASLWSQYKATSTIDASGYGINNLSTINGTPVSSLNPSSWSSFRAYQTVDLSNNSLNNVSSISGEGVQFTIQGNQSVLIDASANVGLQGQGITLFANNVEISAPNGILLDEGIIHSANVLNISSEGNIILDTQTTGVVQILSNLDMSGNDIINVVNIDGKAATPLTLNSTSDIALEAANDAYVEAQAGSANLNGHIDVNLDANTGAVNLTGATGIQLNSATTVGTVGVPKNLTVNGTVDATGDVISSFGGSSPYSLNTIGSLVKTPQAYNYWVATSGSDSTGTGSITNPWATITYALASTASVADSNPISICCTAGTYTESFTVSRNNTFLVGAVGISNVVVIGTISFIPGATAQTTISQGMTGISVVGNIVCSETTATEVNWYLDNVNVTSYGVSAVGATGNATGNTAINFNSCIITQNTTNSAAVQLNSCRGNLTLVQVIQNTTSPALSLFTGNSSVACNGTTLLCAGSATASPIVFVNNTLATGSTNSFLNTTFQYTASTAGSAKTGIQFNNAVNLPTTTLNQCIWYLGGSTTIITRTGIGNVSILWGQNVCSPVSAVPTPSVALAYSYMIQDFIKANTLRDTTNSAGTANQVLTAGATGSSLQWATQTIQSLGGWVATPAATAYRNSLVMYDTSGGVSYDTNAYSCVVVTAPSTNALATTMRGRTYIATSSGAQNLTFTTATLTANDVGFFVKVKNGNPTNGGDITIVGATGNTVIHNKTATSSGGIGYLYWNGTALIAY